MRMATYYDTESKTRKAGAFPIDDNSLLCDFFANSIGIHMAIVTRPFALTGAPNEISIRAFTITKECLNLTLIDIGVTTDRAFQLHALITMPTSTPCLLYTSPSPRDGLLSR